MRGRLVHLSCILALMLAAAMLPAADNRYTIKEGETLFSVARRAQVPVDVLSAYNGITDADKVKVGTVLHVPTGYTVRKGDTLFGIARTFAVPLVKILELNKLGQGAKLKVGSRIYIPQDADKSSVPTAAQTGAQTAVQTSVPPRVDPAVATSAAVSNPGSVVVWPHTGRHEPDNGKIPGLVFFGAPGDVVRSATAGEVKWAATYWTRGKVVIIKSPDGTLFTYGGNAELLVNVGDRVSAGMDIAKLGESPQGGGAKLYFSISDGTGRAVNPEKFFSAKSDS
jgi:lipoprotein NlpD